MPSKAASSLAHAQMFSHFCLFQAVVFFLAFLLPACFEPDCANAASPLTVVNDTHADILNIRVQPESGKGYFWRLDLAPGARDVVDNPGGRATLRIDTGLQLWTFAPVSLDGIGELIFCGEHPACVAFAGDNAKEHIGGSIRDLVPQTGHKPVCALEEFRPRMTMREVCERIEPGAPVDDCGAVLAGLGFAGMTWAGRLAPVQTGPVTGESLLEHLELRQPLTAGSAERLLQALMAKGYVPWQAEMPGMELNFADMPPDAPGRMELLRQAVEKFIKSEKTGLIKANPLDVEPEATIILAPASMLASLANADAPEKDVQIYTVILKPASGTLLLDVAAYQGENTQS